MTEYPPLDSLCANHYGLKQRKDSSRLEKLSLRRRSEKKQIHSASTNLGPEYVFQAWSRAVEKIKTKMFTLVVELYSYQMKQTMNDYK